MKETRPYYIFLFLFAILLGCRSSEINDFEIQAMHYFWRTISLEDTVYTIEVRKYLSINQTGECFEINVDTEGKMCLKKTIIDKKIMSEIANVLEDQKRDTIIFGEMDDPSLVKIIFKREGENREITLPRSEKSIFINYFNSLDSCFILVKCEENIIKEMLDKRQELIDTVIKRAQKDGYLGPFYRIKSRIEIQSQIK